MCREEDCYDARVYPELWPHLQREKVTEWKSVRVNDYVWNEDDSDEDMVFGLGVIIGRAIS